MPKPPTKSNRNSADCRGCATRSICFLGKLPRPDLDVLQLQIHKQNFHRNDVLCIEAEVASSLKIVKLGTVFGYRLGMDGHRRPIGIAGRGAVFGIFSFYGQPNQASAIAVSTGRICEIPVAVLKEHAAVSSVLREQLLLTVVRSYGAALTWSEAMRLRGVVNQLAYTVLLLGDAQNNTVIELPTHTALAALLGTTRETIVRALTALEVDGAVRRLERKKFELFEARLTERLGGNRFRPLVP